MVVDESTDLRVNARSTDAFDIFNLRFYVGPNPYLATGAIAFQFCLTGSRQPLPIQDYLVAIGDRYPDLKHEIYPSFDHLFARTVAEASKLDMDLHLHRWRLQVGNEQGVSFDPAIPKPVQIAVEGLHERTSRGVIYAVWDWFEAITQGQPFEMDRQIARLQAQFRRSLYGGPTVYALLKTAYELGIPTVYLWDEGLMQYGYGKQQVRGVATTFDRDSHLDSDFTTRKDDCKAFLDTLGFPVPQGRMVGNLEEAHRTARKLGYPVVVKPVDGHKGIGVTVDIRDGDALEKAFEQAAQTLTEDSPVRLIVERSIRGRDFRLLCVDGKFVAATERQPPLIVGDGYSSIEALIQQQNRSSARLDTPTSPLGQIIWDEAMATHLQEQGLALSSILERGQTVYLRKIANLSAGGSSVDASRSIHPDNIILAQDIAQHFRLTCLGIDVIAADLEQSWKEGNLGIIEINAAPGIYMHLKPAIGEPVDVTTAILKTFFPRAEAARIPIISLNRISQAALQEMIDYILQHHPTWTIGAACQDAVLINRAEKHLHPDYNLNIQNLLRNPKLDLLIAEYPESVLDRQGMFYRSSDVVILDNPTGMERILAEYINDDATVVIRQGNTASIHRQGLIEQYQMAADELFSRVYLKEIATIL